MKTIHDFQPSDRYTYDFGCCSVSKGFAQVDTSQDASYYGTWANPEKLQILCYCEGDVTLRTADSPEEFAEALLEMKAWNEESGHRFIGIDTGCNDALSERFRSIGLGEMLH